MHVIAELGHSSLSFAYCLHNTWNFFALFFFSQGDGFVPMGIYDGLSGLLLLATYLPALRSGGRD